MIRDHNIQSGTSTPSKSHATSSRLGGRAVWAVILDSQNARVLEKDGLHFNAVWEIENFQPVDDGISNATIGRSGGYGQGRHKYEPSMAQSNQHEIEFAKNLSAWLDKARSEARFDEFVIAASPKMLGEVLKNLSAPLQKCMAAQSSKNMMEFNGKDLETHLLKIVPGPRQE